MSDIRLVKKGEDKLKNITGFGVNRNAVKQMELTAKSSFETLQNYNTKLNNREYLSSDDLKSYKSAMNSYIENNNRLRKLNKIFGQGYTDVQENEWNDAIISLQSGYKEASDYFSQFKDVNEYNDTLAAIKQQETMRAEDQEKLRLQLEEKRHVYNYWNSIASNPVVKKGNINNESLFNPHISVSDSVEAVFDYFDPLKTKYNFDPNSNNDFIIPNTKKYLGEDQNDAKGILSQNQLDSGNLLNKVADAKYAGLTLGELKKQIEEDEKYLTQVRYLQNYFYITENDVSLDELKSHLSDEDPIAYTSTDGKNVTWQKLYEDKKYEEDLNIMYEKYSARPDWEEKSKYYQNNTKKTAADVSSFFDKNIDWQYEHTANYFPMPNKEDKYYSLQMTDKEKEVFNYIYHTQGEDAAYEWHDSIVDRLKERANEKYVETVTKFAEKAPVLSDAASVLTNTFAGAEYIGNFLAGNGVEKSKLATFSQTVRSTRAEQVNWEIGNWDAFDFIYNTGMSMADSAASMVTFGKAGGVALGISAAVQGTNDALDRGLSSKQAFWNGLASGTFEMIFETVSIGQFSALKESLGSGIKNIAKNIGKSMLVNASEETLTEIANIVYDTVMNTDFSNYETKIRAYVASGMTPEEAENQVKNEMTRQIAESAASGALMGFGFGGIGSVSSHINAKAIENAYSKADINNLINIGLSAPESKAYALAQQAQSKTNSGKLLSAQEIVALQQAVTEAVSNADISKIKQAVETRLIELGEGKAASAVAEIIAKQVAGQKLTSSEKSTLKNSKYGQRVVNEIAPENVASGEYSSEWAKSIGTNWINKNVYNRNLQSTANGEGDSVSAVDAFDDGETTGLASGVVQGADGKQYFNDGSGDEYFGDAEGADAPHLTTASGGASPQGEAIDGRAFDLSEPTQKDIARAPTSQEAFDEAITGKQKTNIQRHIVDICKQLDSGITVEFVDGLKTNGKFVRSQNKILIRSDLSAVQMYVEVFKHEFMHRIETKQLYGKFFDYCFKKSTAFEQYVRAELKSAGVDYNVDTATRVGVIEAYTKYKFDQYKNSKVIPQKDRDAFTMENAREEIIADFFAEVLFQGEQYRERIISALENADGEYLVNIGDEISSEAALLELQQKEPTLFEKVVGWIRDIINKLRGMPQAKTLESDLEYLEDMLARVYWSKDSKKALQNKAKESDVSYCFARCEDSELISQAEKMEKMGEQPIPIYQELGLVRNVYGEWATEIELDGYRFSPYGNWQSYGLVKKQGYIEGRLRDVVVWPELYEKFPEFEDVKIIIKPSEFEHDTMKFIPDENTGTIFINQKLCDDYIDRTNFDAKVLMVETIQHMIQHKEGNYSEKNYDYWKMLEEKGELPYSKKLGRYLTADDMMKYFADNYDANIAGRRQFMKYIATNLDKKPDSYKNSVLYLPNIDPEEVIVYGKRGKLMSLKEKNTVKKRFNILDKNYNSNTKETESYIFDEKGEATQSLRNLVWQKAQKHGAKFRQMISQIKGGNSGFAEKSDIDARERIKNQIELASKISVADTDTVNRKNNAEIRQNMQGSIAVNQKGQPISLYALSTHGDDLFKNSQIGIKLSTITAMSEMYNSEDMRYKRVKFFECYAVAKKPFYLESEPYELSVGEIGFQMVESGILSRNTYLKLVNAQNQNIANRKMVDLLKDLGYDSIAYKNSNYDKGSISLVVFDEGQLIRVSEDGMLIENNGIEDTDYVDYVDQSNERFDSVKENNEKMPRYLDEPNYNLRKVRKQVDSRIKLGDAGYLEQFGANVTETVEYIKDMLRLNIGVELSGYDNADRKFKNKAVKQFDQCAFRDENGDILTFDLWNTSNKNISQVAKMGIEFGTVNAAFKKFFAHKESMTQRYNGVFEEFILNCYNPLVVPLDNWNAKKLAEYLLSTGEITQKYYEKLISLKTITSPTYNSNASQILREKIKMMGYDCIVFVKSSGNVGVIPFYDSQVVPISQNGILNSDCDLYVENEYMVENPKDGEVISQEGRVRRDFSKVKDIIMSEPSATKKLMHLTEFLSYASDSILEENQDINVGSSGVFENLGHNVWKFVSVCKNLLSDTARSVEINQLDIADRFVAENVREYLYDTIFKNNDGKLLSFFVWNKYGENRFKHSSLGYNLTTLTGAHNNYLAEREKHNMLNKGEYEEYYIKASKPYIMPFVSEQLTAKSFAEELYKDGIISGREYGTISSFANSDSSDMFSFATQYLKSALIEKGYDSIIYMSSKDGGTVGVIVFEPSQLIPVSINGKQIENSQLTLTDSQGSVYLSEFVEKEIKKNIENLDERDIIKLARAYLRSPEGKKDKRPYLRHRPSYLKNQIEMVYENAKKLLGKVYDPSGVELHWDPTKPRNGQWDMGHIPGQKYEVVHAKYVLGMMTPKEFKTWYRDPRNYRPELPSTNRGHKYE